MLVAEVQAFFADGAMSLHTRSLKYGKVRPKHERTSPVSPLAQKRPTRFGASCPYSQAEISFLFTPSGVNWILGLNGYIWISKHVQDNDNEGEEGLDAEAV